jgi:hypothetical protein
MRVHAGFAVSLFPLAIAACSSEEPAPTVPRPIDPSTTGAGGAGAEGGGPASSSGGTGGAAPDCTGSDPKPGCDCDTEGELWDCGQVYSKVGNQLVCGPGRMACAGGVWGECVLSNIPL